MPGHLNAVRDTAPRASHGSHREPLARRHAQVHAHSLGLHGVRPLDAAAPVTQPGYCEAAAYAQWAGARLPTEAEREAAYGLVATPPGHARRTCRNFFAPAARWQFSRLRLARDAAC